MQISEIESVFSRHAVEYLQNKRQLELEEASLEAAEARTRLLQEASLIVRGIAKDMQQKAHKKVSQLVSSCLRAVFDAPYTFLIQFEEKRNKTEASFVFLRDGYEIDPLTAAGGGVVDVAAFGLRLACLMLSKPHKRKLLVLDEPMRYVSAEYLPRVVDLVERMSEECGVQIILVTHSPEFKVGNVIEVV